MAIAIPFALDNAKWNNRKDIEFNIPYDSGRHKELDKFLDFLDEYPDVRINLEFKDEISLHDLSVINKISDNVYVRISIKDVPKVKDMREKGYKFFFDSELPAYNFSLLESFIDMGTTDIYIADDLCYDLDTVKKYLNSVGVNIRLILNKIPMTTPDRGLNEKTVLFRPNDIDYLKQYFDAFEFDCGKPYNFKKLDVLYRVYFIQKEWLGEISEINEDYNIPLHNRTIQDDYDLYRMNCGRKCNHNRICNKCKNMYDAANKLYDKNVVRKKNKERIRNTIKIGKYQYDLINSKLENLSKGDERVKYYKEVFDDMKLPLVWMEAYGYYQLDPCLLEKAGESE
mgnify:CR=1 FL=1